ncbi:hypothetical protein L6164_002981 [Bauhinia variegata]|uniref:Uncharacterized protein n=1 Tax=Bauhinia variegata TaxID=167791 RepID=A0ACB9PZV6_BAUVA|nr:hypothetical protein L6164_002981 [Bauhinia variegata]
MERKVEAIQKPKRPSFFKLIPRLFVKKYRSIFSDKAVLEVFPRKTWTVDIVEEDVNKLYFKNGWRTFVKENSLQYGEFVIFKYEGNSTFKVKMYGFSCCDKAIEMGTHQYQNVNADKENHSERKSNAENGHKQKQEENSDSNCDRNQSEALKGENVSKRHEKEAEEQRKEDSKRGQEAEEKAKGVSNEAEPLKGSGDKRRIDQEAEEDVKDIIEIVSDSDGEIGDVGNRRRTKKKRRTIPSVIKEGSKQFKLKSPAFQVVLPPAYIKRNFLNVPIDFFKEHLQQKEQNVELHSSKGKWIVKLAPYSVRRSKYARLSKGWLNFVRDNKLKVGQTCVFELIRSNRPLFQVHVLENQ